MPGLLLATGYLALLLYFMRRSSFYRLPGVPLRWLAGAFVLKVLAGTALWWIYTYSYTDRANADLYKYFDDSAVLYDALWTRPLDYFRMLLGIANDNEHFNTHYYRVMNNWMRKYESNLANDSHTMIRFNAFVRLFSDGQIHVHTVFAAFLSFTGLTAIGKAMAPHLPGREKALFAVLFLIPSVVFWASGVIKESLLFFGLGLLLWKLFAALEGRGRWRDLPVFGFCLVLLFYLKFYVLLSMTPALVALVWCRLRPGRPALKFALTFVVLGLAALNVHHLIPGFNVLEVLWWKHSDFIGLANLMQSGSFISPPPLEPTGLSFAKYAPHALFMTFLSPLLMARQGAMGLVAAAETVALIAILMWLLLHRRRAGTDAALVLFCLSFALVLALVIGWTTPVVGAVVRYRVPLLPFLMIAALLLADPSKHLLPLRLRGLLPFLAALLLFGCAHKHREADLVVHNAHIVSLDEQDRVYQAMAIVDGRIVELGAEQQIRNRYRAKETYDAAGRWIYPGFIDGHCHFFGYGLNKQKVDLGGVKDWDEALARTKAFADAHPEKEWILGRGWDQNLWAEQRMPDNTKLNALFPDRPVLLQRVDGHAAVANQVALDRVGLTGASRIAGGIMELREDQPTGLLIDNAVDVFQKIFDEADAATKRQALLDAQRDCLAAGLTMVCDAGLDTNTIALIGRMQQEGMLKIRVYAMVADKPEHLAHFATTGPVIGERLIVRSVKVYADGALGSRGALLKEPYSDQHGHHGLQLATREHFLEVAQWCKANGFQMATHAIGDSANKLLLEVYGEVLGSTNDLRWRIEHAQVVTPADIELFSRYTVIPSVQPTHATSDGPWAKDRLGEARIPDAYAYSRLQHAMGILALGTDFPVEPIDPLGTFRSAVFRISPTGWPEGGYRKENALSALDALRGMTIWNAIASFTESDLGTLEVGKQADFVVLDADLRAVSEAVLPTLKVQATAIGGELVFRR